jgi:adenylate kinase family enzyme
MVTTVNNRANDNAVIKKHPILMELVGPAGAGKTTLAEALSRQGIRISTAPYFRRTGDIPFFFRNTLSLLPTFFRLYHSHDGRWLTRREMAWMVTLNEWHGVLRKTSNSGTIIVLDQGPVFLLVQLYMFGPECLKTRDADKWWDRMLKQWAVTLDRIIYLDASDTELLKRIRNRRKEHVIKEESEAKVFEFLARYRLAYEQMISILMGHDHSLKVLYFDTGSESIVGIVDKLLAEIDWGSAGGEGRQVPPISRVGL